MKPNDCPPKFAGLGVFLASMVFSVVALSSARVYAQTTFPAPVTIAADGGGSPLFLKGRVPDQNQNDQLSQIAFLDSNGSTYHGLYQTFKDGQISFIGTTGAGTGNLVERMRISGNGVVSVGMGPSGFANFEVNGYIAAVNATAPFLQLYATSGASGQKFWRTGIAGGSMVFEQVNDAYTTPTERLRISPEGNIGIGVSTPIRAIHAGTAGGAELILEGTDGQANYRKWNFYVGGSAGNQKALFLRILNDAGTLSTIESMVWAPSGNVGIGTINPTHKLAVNGAIRAKEVIVDTNWADYVFADDYRLASLSEVEAHIRSRRHLPGIPSATEVADRGVSIGEMQSKLLAKIEELTLHLIAQDKELRLQRAEIHALRRETSGQTEPAP